MNRARLGDGDCSHPLFLEGKDNSEDFCKLRRGAKKLRRGLVKCEKTERVRRSRAQDHILPITSSAASEIGSCTDLTSVFFRRVDSTFQGEGRRVLEVQTSCGVVSTCTLPLWDRLPTAIALFIYRKPYFSWVGEVLPSPWVNGYSILLKETFETF